MLLWQKTHKCVSICIPALYKLLSVMHYRLLKAICMVMGGHMVSHQGRVGLSWVNPESLSSRWVRMGPQILTRLAGTARILGMSWGTV